jgi:hypothetical protein
MHLDTDKLASYPDHTPKDSVIIMQHKRLVRIVNTRLSLRSCDLMDSGPPSWSRKKSRLLSGPPDRLGAPLVCHHAEHKKGAVDPPIPSGPSGIIGMSRPDSTDRMHEIEVYVLSDILF